MDSRGRKPIVHPVPEIEILQVVKLSFGRGDGIDERSTYRKVDAFYLLHEGGRTGRLLAVEDPVAVSFVGRVIDAGGGEVRILVDRDTMQYPSDGAVVRVEVAP